MTKLGSGTSTSATQILEILILFFFQWGSHNLCPIHHGHWCYSSSSICVGVQLFLQCKWFPGNLSIKNVVYLLSHPLLNMLECTGPGGYTSFMFHLTTTSCKIHHCHKRILIWSNFSPFMPIQSFCKIICQTNFGQNFTVLPFKWNLFERTERKHRSV